MRAAIVGLGRWGRTIVEALDGYERITFVRAVEPALDGARDFCAERGIALTDDFASVLADTSIDAVILATPHSLHRAQVIACAAAGKHIFCEKPLALTVGDASAMFAACRSAGVTLAVGHNRRFWPSMQALRAIVESGELGTLLHAEGHNSNENSKAVTHGWRLLPAESPGGGLTGSGLHVLDGLVAILGPVRRVQAQLLVSRPEPPQLDTATAMLQFATGVSATLATIRMTPFYWRVHIFGTDGSAEVLSETSLILRKSGAAPEARSYPAVNVLRAELDAFVDDFEKKQPFPVLETEVLATLAAFEATLASMRDGKPVDCHDA